MPQRFGTVLAGDTRLAVREWGPEDGTPVLFWHALGPVTTGEYSAVLAPSLAGVRLLAPDAPGHGESPALPRECYAVGRTVELAVSLLDALGIGRVAFVGHSWGAMIGAHLAAAAPERLSALVLLDAGYGDPAELPGVPAITYEERLAQARAAQEQWRWPNWEAFDADADGLATVGRAGVREENGEIVARVAPEARAAIQDALYASSISSTWPALRALPVLLLVATEPAELEPYRREAVARFSAAVPDADVHRIERAGHDLLADAGRDVGDLMAPWLAAHRSTATLD
jgi:pimeloyl-ACP methyl ester carboxylesterase